MKFELDTQSHHFILELTPDPSYLPDGQFDIFDQEDLNEHLGDHLAFYQITIVSHPIGKNEIMTHYQGGLLLPQDQEELQDELGALIDNNNYLGHIINQWQLATDS